MKDVADVTACVVDCGLYLPLARRLGQAYQKVYYWSPDCRLNKSVRQECVGDGFPEIERVREFWPLLDEIDLFVFPDSDQAGLQLHLESLGKAVWGSRRGQDLELDRELFLRTLKRVGLQVPPYITKTGIEALRDYLREEEDKYIKISYYRADMETKHWRSWDLDETWLDSLAVRLMPHLNRQMQFLVFGPIETDLEIGADTYCVDGQMPELLLQGYEGKNRCYFSAVTKREDMPEPVRRVLDAFTPELAALRYRNQISFEIRVKGDDAYFIDATQRGGLPSTGSQLYMWANFPDAVWSGANGILVEPDPGARYSIETVITTSTAADCAEVVELPEALEDQVHFSGCCQVGKNLYLFPPGEGERDLGWLLATGDTPKATLAAAKETADHLPDGLESDVESLATIIEAIDQAESEGHAFSEEPMPQPQEVI